MTTTAKTTFTKIDGKSQLFEFVKVHDGNESLTECKKLYDGLSASSKKMLHSFNGGWDFIIRPNSKCELFVNKNTNNGNI